MYTLDSFGHKHWPFMGDVPQQRIRVFVILLGKDAIGSRKMQTWSAKLVHLVGFHFRTHTLKPFRTERAIQIKPLIACYIIVDMYE